MNSFTNSLLIFFTIPLMCFVVYVGYDVPIDFMHTTGGNPLSRIYIFRFWIGLFYASGLEKYTQVDGIILL